MREDSAQKLEVIYRRHRQAMFRAAKRVLSDDALAEDAVADAVLRLSKIIDTVRNDSPKETASFVCRIATGIAIDMVRRRAREVSLSPSLSRDDSFSMEAKLHAEELLASLPEEDALILRMKYIEGYSYEDISRAVGKSASAVRKRAERAKRALVLKERKEESR